MNLVGLIAISLALGALAWLGFLWSVRSGQYDDPEGPKYRMLEEDEPPPGRPAPPASPAAGPEGAGGAIGPAAGGARPDGAPGAGDPPNSP